MNPYPFRYITLLALTIAANCSGMKQIIKAVSAKNNGGIQSLTMGKKEGSEVFIVGHARCEQLEIGPLINGDAKAKETLLQYLDVLRQGKVPVALLTFDSKETCTKQAKQFAGKHPSTFYMPLQAAINAVGASNNHTIDKLSIITTERMKDYQTKPWDPTLFFDPGTFPQLAEKAKLKQKTTADLELALAKSSLLARKRYFSKQREFSKFVRTAKKELHNLMTIEEYFTLVKNLKRKTAKLVKTTTGFCKERAEIVDHLLTLQELQAASYLAAYGVTTYDITLFEALAEVIKKRRSLVHGCREFYFELSLPIQHYIDLTLLCATRKTLESHPNIIIFHDYERMEPLLHLLGSLDYELGSTGIFSTAWSAREPLPIASLFTQAICNAFFSMTFGGIDTKEVHMIDKDSPFYEHLCIDNKSIGSLLALLQTEQELAELQNEIQDLKDQLPQKEEFTCKSCSKRHDKEGSRVVYVKEKEVLCSVSCMTNHLLKNALPSLKKIVAKTDASKKEKPLLRQLGAFCYLQYAALSPSESTLIRLGKEGYLGLLADTEKDPSWNQAHTQANLLQIDASCLAGFLHTAVILNSDLLKSRIASAKHKKELKPVFDPEGTLFKKRKELLSTLKKVFEAQGAADHLICRAYYRLAMQCFAKGEGSLKTMKQVFAKELITIKERPLDELVASITGDKKKSRKNKKKR